MLPFLLLRTLPIEYPPTVILQDELTFVSRTHSVCECMPRSALAVVAQVTRTPRLALPPRLLFLDHTSTPRIMTLDM